jgi:HEAT repeat protein/S1-C subfamily serine protease/DNA-directed RNA polymerase subunit RPC12/RpoP
MNGFWELAPMISFRCPNCECELEVRDKAAGSKVTCPECEERVVVPMRSISPKRTERLPGRQKRAPSGTNNTVLIVAGAGAATLVLVALVVVFVVLRPPGSKGQQAAAPMEIAQVQVPRPVVRPASTEQKVQEKKPAEPDGTTLAARIVGAGPSGADIHKHVLKSVAWILTLIDRRTGDGASGSGTLIDRENRLVLTNQHVINQGQDLIVFFPKNRDGQLVVSKEEYMKQIEREDLRNVIHGRVVAQDQTCDLALIQLDSVPEGIEALALANKSADYGEMVHSVGITGASGGLWGYTKGEVRVRAYDKTWRDQNGQHRAKIVEATNPTNPGDSGGPLVNGLGEMVAVTQAGLVGAQSLNQFVDVSHAISLIQNYCRQQNVKWNRATGSLKVGSNPDDIMLLVKSLESPDNHDRGQIAQALGKIGAEAKLAIPALLKLLRDEQNDTTSGALADALAKIGPPAKQDAALLREAVKDLNPKVRAYAAASIGAIGPDAGSLLTLLTGAAKDKNVEVRQNAVRSLGKMGGNGKDAIMPALTAALNDSEHEVRVAAAMALESMDALGATDVALLTSLLKQQDSEVRACGARALGKMGPRAKAALPALMEAFKGTDNALRRAAIGALASLGAEAKTAVVAFSDALGDSDVEIRKQAAAALAKIGPEAKPAAEALAKVVVDPDKEVRKNAVKALGAIGVGTKPVVSALVQALKGEDKELRIDVAAALAAIGPPAKDAVPYLIVCLEDLGPKDKVQRNQIGTGLGKIGKGKESITLLINALYSPNPSVRSGACIALGEVGPPAKRASVYLATLATNDAIPEVCDAARTAYSKVTAKP